MKVAVVLALLALVACVSSVPLPEEELVNLEELYEGDENAGIRQRRVTCDLLSYGGKVNHSACAANCLSMGKAGGRCNDGICQCRKTSFKDLWDKRFG